MVLVLFVLIMTLFVIQRNTIVKSLIKIYFLILKYLFCAQFKPKKNLT